MGEPVPYVVGGVEVAPGPKKQVKLPARVFRGRLTGLLFETNKTFLLPGSLKGIRGLRNFYEQHPGMQVLVVGHSPPPTTSRPSAPRTPASSTARQRIPRPS